MVFACFKTVMEINPQRSDVCTITDFSFGAVNDVTCLFFSPHNRHTTSNTTMSVQHTDTDKPQHSTAQHSTAQHSTAQHSTAQHSTAQHSTAQHSTAQHSTAQHSTAQHSTAQHSTHLPRHRPHHHFLCSSNTLSREGSSFFDPTPFQTSRRLH